MTDMGHNGGPPIIDDVPNMHFVKFFPGDFLNGTAHMSLEMVGAYIRTLCIMYDRMGGFPADEHLGATLMRVDKRVYRRVRDQLLADGKIFIDGDTIRNVRVEKEISDYISEYKRRSEAAKKREAERRERQTYAGLSPDLSGTSAELTPEVRDKLDELEAKNTTKTTKIKAQEGDILEARSQKLEARREVSNPPTPQGGVDRKAINRDAARQAFVQWQGLAMMCGLTVPRDTSFETYGQKIAARMFEHAAAPKGVAEMLGVWQAALVNVERSSFLRGLSATNFRADLKFVCQRESFAKLIDGGFGNGAHAGKSHSEIDALCGTVSRGHLSPADDDLLADIAGVAR